MGLLTDLLGDGNATSTPWRADGWYSPPVVSLTTMVPNEGVVMASGLLIPAGVSITGLAVEVTSAGTTGAVVRLGVFSLDESGNATLEVDAGTVSGTATGIHTAAPALAAKARPWWAALTATVQGAADTRPTLRAHTPTFQAPFHRTDASSLMALTGAGGFLATGASGALPSSGSVQPGSTVPRVLVKGTIT